MRRALRIARREYVATVCTRGFILGLILVPLMMGGGLIGVAIMQRQAATHDRTIAVIDESGIVAPAITAAAADRNEEQSRRQPPGPRYTIEVLEPAADRDAQRLELSDRIRAGGLHAFVEIGPSVVDPREDDEASRIRYFSKNPALDEVRGWLGNVVNDRLRRARLEQAGIDPAALTNLFSWVSLEGMQLAQRDERTGEVSAASRQDPVAAMGIPFGVAVLAMILIMMGAAPLLQSVMEEKSQRIAEFILGAATPWDLMMGKVLGGVGVALTAMVLYLAVAIGGLGSIIAAADLPWRILPWFVVYVVAAIMMFGALGTALGSACNDARDAQHLQGPVILPLVFPIFLVMPVIQDPLGALATIASFIPPFTPLLMLLRLSTPGGIPWWQPWVGLAGVLATTCLVVWIAGRIFRVGILMQGKPPTIREIVRWGFRG